MIFDILGAVFGDHPFGPTDPFFFHPVGRQTSAGVRVTDDIALTYSAIWCASRVISETVARLPLITYERFIQADGTFNRQRAPTFHLYDLLKVAPNNETTIMAWLESQVERQVNAGNAIAEIEKDAGGKPAALWPIDPHRVIPMRDESHTLFYRVRNNDGSTTDLPFQDVFHVPGVLPIQGIWGRGVVHHGRESIGMGLATEDYGASILSNAAVPAGVIEVPVGSPSLKTETARKNFRREWNEQHKGSENAGNIGILWGGATHKALSFSSKDTQFLETRAFNITEISRWYNITPHKLHDLSRATFSNVEQTAIDFVMHTIVPWLVRWEQAIMFQLFTPEERAEFFVEFLVDGLLRGDLKSRFESYAIGLLNGWLTINKVLRFENQNGIGPEGDVHRVPLNTAPIGEDNATQQALRLSVQDGVEKLLAGQSGAVEQIVAAQNENISGMTDAIKTIVAEDFAAAKEEAEESRRIVVGKVQAAHNAVRVRNTEELVGATQDRQAAEAARDQAIAATRHNMKNAFTRMLVKESQAAVRAAGKPRAFLVWLDEFYGKHESQLAEALVPAVAACRSLGIGLDAKPFALDWCKVSREQLTAAYDTPPGDTFAERVSECVDAWRGRIDDAILYLTE